MPRSPQWGSPITGPVMTGRPHLIMFTRQAHASAFARLVPGEVRRMSQPQAPSRTCGPRRRPLATAPHYAVRFRSPASARWSGAWRVHVTHGSLLGLLASRSG
jgi:hypothetical protein